MSIVKKSPLELQTQVYNLSDIRINPYTNEFRDVLRNVWHQGVPTSSTILDLFSISNIKKNKCYYDYLYALRKMRFCTQVYKNMSDTSAVLLVPGRLAPWIYNTAALHKCMLSSFIYTKKDGYHKLDAPIGQLFNDIKFLIEDKERYTEIQISKKFATRLQKYLVMYKAKKVTDCNHFERHMLNVIDTLTYDEIVRADSWNGNYKELKSGDVVALYKNNRNNPSHKAIYLGDKLFISKLGKKMLAVSTLEQLHNLYDTNNVCLKKFFWESKSYEEQKEETVRILETHPDRERLITMFANVQKYGIS